MRPTGPVIVVDLIPEERSELLELLRSLDQRQWQEATACPGWSVRDVAAHLLGGDLGKLSRTRDGYVNDSPRPGEEFSGFLNRINDEWVIATRRLSPQVLCDLLEASGREVSALFASLDLHATGPPVTWAGQDTAPVWLDVAREYTERWHHQQHIREAVGAAGLTSPRFMAPALATFVRALPHTYRDIQAPDATAVQIHILGDSGDDWIVYREQSGWRLYSGALADPVARVTLDADVAWRLFTNGISREYAGQHVRFDGDDQLARQFLRSVAIID